MDHKSFPSGYIRLSVWPAVCVAHGNMAVIVQVAQYVNYLPLWCKNVIYRVVVFKGRQIVSIRLLSTGSRQWGQFFLIAR